MRKKYSLLIFIGLLVFIFGCTQEKSSKIIFRCDGNWYMPPAFHGNPYAPGGDGSFMHFVWERLFLLVPENPEGRQIIPRLGLNYQIDKNRNNLTIQLRNDVIWHDLVPFTSQDIKMTFYLKFLQGWGDGIERIDTPDKYTVIFRYRKPIGTIDERVIFNEKIMGAFHLYQEFFSETEELMRQSAEIPMDFEKSDNPFNKEKYNLLNEGIKIKKANIMQRVYLFRPEKPIGTGAFKFSFASASDLGLVKFEKGWEAKNISIDEIRILKSASNDITWAYLISGELDSAHPATSEDVTRQILKINPKNRLVLPSDYGEFGFIFNLKRFPTDKLELRKGIAYGIDHDLIRMISYFYSTTVKGYSTGVLDSLKDKFIDKEFMKKLTHYSYKPEKAHTLFQKAGLIKNRDGFYTTQEGMEINLEIAAQAGSSDCILACESLVSQLAKLGIKAQIRTYEASLFNQLLSTNKFDIAAQFGSDYKAFAHPAPSFNRFYGKGAYIKVASGMPDIVKGPEGNDLYPEKEMERLFQEQNPKKFQEALNNLIWTTNEYLPFLCVYEKRLMIFLNDGERVKGWPSKEDPIWSACASGLEAVFSYLISTGTVKGVKELQ